MRQMVAASLLVRAKASAKVDLAAISFGNEMRPAGRRVVVGL